MSEKFDCIAFKYSLQKQLYNKLNPRDFDDYFDKLVKNSGTNSLYRKIKDKSKRKGSVRLEL